MYMFAYMHAKTPACPHTRAPWTRTAAHIWSKGLRRQPIHAGGRVTQLILQAWNARPHLSMAFQIPMKCHKEKRCILSFSLLKCASGLCDDKERRIRSNRAPWLKTMIWWKIQFKTVDKKTSSLNETVSNPNWILYWHETKITFLL